MRYPLIVAALVGVFATGQALAAGIAVVEFSAVVENSDATKKAKEKYDAATKVQRERMEKLQEEIQALQARYKKEEAILSEADKKALQKQGEDKVGEFQRLGQAVTEAKQRTEQDLQRTLVPRIRAVIEELRKANKYDLVLERQGGVLAADPALDLTRKVIEKVNAAPAAAK